MKRAKHASMKDVDWTELRSERATRGAQTRERNRQARMAAERSDEEVKERINAHYLSEQETYVDPETSEHLRAEKQRFFEKYGKHWDEKPAPPSRARLPRTAPQTHLSDRVLRSHEGEDYEVVSREGGMEARRRGSRMWLVELPKPDPVTTLKLTIPIVSESGEPLRDITIPVPITIPEDEWHEGNVATITTPLTHQGVKYPLKFDVPLSTGYQPELEHRVEPVTILPKVHRENTVVRDEEGFIDHTIQKEY